MPSGAALRPDERQIADRYLLYVRQLERLYASADPSAVAMSAVATGEQLRKVVDIAVRMRNRGQHATGSFRDAVGSVVRGGDAATLTSCQDANAVRVFATASGKLVGPVEPLPRRVQRVVLVLLDGRWLVSSVRNDGVC
jgi:hypothetical protein